MRTPVTKSFAAVAAALKRAYKDRTKAAVAIRSKGGGPDEEVNGLAMLHGELHVHRRSDRAFLVVVPDDEIVEVDSKADLRTT